MIIEANNSEAICKEYAQVKNKYAALCERVRNILADLLDRENLKFHSITYRVKEEDSIRGKLAARINRKYSCLEQITDVAGLRVITYYTDEVDAIAKLIEREFDVDEEHSIDKRRVLDPDRFGYISIHYVIKIGDKTKQLARYKNMRAEIQIRSILQHTWAEIEHDLGYKNKYGVPKEIRRDFSRLAGLLELADKEFSEIRKRIIDYAARVSKQMKTDKCDILIDDNSIELYLSYNNTVNSLTYAISKITNGDFKEDTSGISSVVRELNWLGLEKIKDVDEALAENYDLALYMARRILKNRSRQPVDRTAGLFYLCYAVLAKDQDAAKVVRYWSDNKINVPGRTVKENLKRAHQLLLFYQDFLNSNAECPPLPGAEE